MKNIIGKQFNNLKVLSIHHKRQVFLTNGIKNGFKYYYLCECICGKKCIVEGRHLIAEHTKSCGCMTVKHNLTGSRLFRIWNGMLNRCYNPNNHKYKVYGNIGIAVCKEWKENFKVFYDWAISNGYEDVLTIDRIDVNGNYEPTNCRWANVKTQNNNRRNNRLITYKNATHTLSEWSEILNIKRSTLKSRFKYNWSIQKAFTTPVRKSRNLR